MTTYRLVLCSLIAAPLVGAAQPPADRFAALEARLDAARSIEIEFAVTAEGAITADLQGRMALEAGKALTLDAEGHFGGEPVDVEATADLVNLSLGRGGADALTMRRPEALDAAVLVGLTRMGILHNLARLTAGRGIDHAAGGVREWVTVDRFTADGDAISFALTVDGQAAGMASLTLDSTGLPLRREQRVVFPEGEMRVTESYRRVAVEP